MSEPNPDSKPPWLGSITAKIIGATALIAASVGLINGAIDLYKAVANVPTNIYDKTNDELFKRHFGKQPIVSQPVAISSTNITVEMLLQVFESGDVFVRYGDLQQWLPFKPLKTTARSLISEALAQTSLPLPAPMQKGGTAPYSQRIIIDIDKLKQEQIEKSSRDREQKPNIIEKSYLLEKLKDDHPNLFTGSSKPYTQDFKAETGYKIIKYEFHLASANNHQIREIKQVEDTMIRISFSLTSGPLLDQTRGWVRGTLKTTQQRIP
jgi:hypothetical protein